MTTNPTNKRVFHNDDPSSSNDRQLSQIYREDGVTDYLKMVFPIYSDTPDTPYTYAPFSGIRSMEDIAPHIRTQFFPLQRLFVENRLNDIFTTTNVAIPPVLDLKKPLPKEPERQQVTFADSKDVLTIDKTFGEFPTYQIYLKDSENPKPLLIVSKANLPNLWQVKNGTMFHNVSYEKKIAIIHEFPSTTLENNSLFAFAADKEVIPDMPRLEMEPISLSKNGSCYAQYEIRMTSIKKKIGTVNVMRYFHDMVLQNCSSEDACLCLCLLIAAEVETKTKLKDVRSPLDSPAV